MGFTIATYNILADAYIKREWYPHTAERFLEPTARRSALLRHLRELGCDVFCLQEVEPLAFDEIEAHLRPLGYKSHFAKKAGGKPDGCATIYRSNVFKLRDVVRLEYRDAQSGGQTSGHIVQLLSLEHEARRVGIANTHLKWDPPGTPHAEQFGYQQISQLLQERDRGIPGCTAWIICGDLNSTPDGTSISLIKQAGFRFTHEGCHHPYTANSNGTAKTIDYVFYSEALESEPFPLPQIDSQTPLPGVDQPSDHVAVVARFHWKENNQAI